MDDSIGSNRRPGRGSNYNVARNPGDHDGNGLTGDETATNASMQTFAPLTVTKRHDEDHNRRRQGPPAQVYWRLVIG